MGKSLGRYLLVRVLLLVPLLVGITMLTFALVRLGSANPAVMIAGPTAGEEQIQAIEHELGLDRSLPEQYWIYLQNAVRGDLGTSWISNRPVLNELLERLPITLELMTFGMLAAIVLGVDRKSVV